MMPARVAMALQADGWWLRSEIVWHKYLSGGAWLYAETQKGIGPHMHKDLVRLDPSTVRLWNAKDWTRVVAWSQSPTPRGEPVEIVLRSGERIGCTPDQRWRTQQGLIVARNLQVRDVIDSCKLPFSDHGGQPPWLHDDALWFAGLHLAEGSMSSETIQLAETYQGAGALAAHSGTMRDTMGLRRVCTKPATARCIHIDQAADLLGVLKTTLSGRTAKDKRLNARVWS